MFGTMLTVATTIMQAYIIFRAATTKVITGHIRPRTLVLAGVLMWVFFLLARYGERSAEGTLAVILELFSMNWLASMFLMTVCMLIIDIFTGFGLFMRRFVPVLRAGALAAGILLVLLAMLQGLRAPVVEDYEVVIPGLPVGADGLVIVGLSDLHLGALIGADWLEARVDQALAEKPDLIVLLGDLVEGHGEIQGDIRSGFSRLSAPSGVWAIPGNHDRYGRGNVAEMLQNAGIELLVNRWTEIQPGLVLAGIEDLYRRRGNLDFDPIERALAGRPPGATVLLSHAPEQVARAAASGVDLMLSGHTHGGQIWPFGYLVKTRNPYLSGRYEVDGMPLIVCRGTGTWGPRMRLWPPGEILRITLRSSGSPSTG